MRILPKLNNSSNNEKIEKKVISLIDKLNKVHSLENEEYLYILDNITKTEKNYLFMLADKVRKYNYDKKVFMRGLIEFSNYCKQGCLYCGIRSENRKVKRYRLSEEDILNCCKEGYRLGYRTFVLQGGEDAFYNDDKLESIIKSIKDEFPECAVTLSFGERSKESYQRFYNAGVDRYLLRHETASKSLYENLHPEYMSYENRIKCLWNLKDIGYQVGAGFMVDSPTQTNEDLTQDLLFLEKFQPEMCGIGPYLCHEDTPLRGNKSGNIDQTLVMVALVRLVLPKVLLPSTTALGTLDNRGREKALKAGANVVMPNLSPLEHREKYEIYQDKICTGDEAAHCRGCIETRIVFSGYEVDMSIGHHKDCVKTI